MQRYRADKSKTQSDGAITWYAIWMGGPTLSRINNCRIDTMAGDMRRTVYVTGEADTHFSIPAACKLAGCSVKGYITSDDAGDLVFRHCYY